MNRFPLGLFLSSAVVASTVGLACGGGKLPTESDVTLTVDPQALQMPVGDSALVRVSTYVELTGSAQSTRLALRAESSDPGVVAQPSASSWAEADVELTRSTGDTQVSFVAKHTQTALSVLELTCVGQGVAEVTVQIGEVPEHGSLRLEDGLSPAATQSITVTCGDGGGQGGGGAGGSGASGGNGGGGNGGGGGGGGTSALPPHTVLAGNPTLDADGCLTSADPAGILLDEAVSADAVELTVAGHLDTDDASGEPLPIGEIYVAMFGQAGADQISGAFVGGWSMLDVLIADPALELADAAPVPGPFDANEHPFELVVRGDRASQTMAVSSPHVGDDTTLVEAGPLGAPYGDRVAIVFVNGRVCGAALTQ